MISPAVSQVCSCFKNIKVCSCFKNIKVILGFYIATVAIACVTAIEGAACTGVTWRKYILCCSECDVPLALSLSALVIGLVTVIIASLKCLLKKVGVPFKRFCCYLAYPRDGGKAPGPTGRNVEAVRSSPASATEVAIGDVNSGIGNPGNQNQGDQNQGNVAVINETTKEPAASRLEPNERRNGDNDTNTGTTNNQNQRLPPLQGNDSQTGNEKTNSKKGKKKGSKKGKKKKKTEKNKEAEEEQDGSKSPQSLSGVKVEGSSSKLTDIEAPQHD